MSFIFGGKRQKETEETVLDPEKYPSTQAARPLPVFWGMARLNCTYICDLFNIRPVPVTETYSSGGFGFRKSRTVTKGYNMYASYACAICIGAVDSLRMIYLNGADTPSWDSTLDSSSADGNGQTTVAVEGFGNIRFYWGKSTQQPDALLQSVYPAGAYPNICYAVFDDVFLGQSTTAPTVEFVVVRRATTGMDSETPHVQDDALLPACMADLLTNPLYGLQLDASKLDLASFKSSAIALRTEGMAFSPVLRQSKTLREVCAELLPYVNGFMHYSGGQMSFGLQREDTGGTPVSVTESDCLEEPVITRPSWAETWNETRVTFSNRNRDFVDDVATVTDAANADVQGQTVQQELDRSYVTRYDVAAGMAQAIAKSAGLPAAKVSLTLNTSFSSLYVGQAIDLSYSPLGISSFPLRVTEIRIGAPDNPQVYVDCTEDTSRLSTLSITPVEPPTTLPPIETPSPCFLRMGLLPSGLLADAPDGVLAAAGRPTSTTIGQRIFLNWNPSLDWTPLTEIMSYPIAFTINRWRRYNSGTFLLDMTLAQSFENSALAAYKDANEELSVCLMLRRKKRSGSIDQHQLITAWATLPLGGRFATVASAQWEIEITPGDFSSQPLALEDLVTPADGYWPCTTGFIGRQSDFCIMPLSRWNIARSGGNDPSDSDQKRYIRTTTRTIKTVQDLASATQVYFDRNDTSMNANGTLGTSWGSAAPNKEYMTLVHDATPLAYLRLADATASTTAADNSGNSRSATAASVTFQQTSPLALETSDKAASFNGSSSWLDWGNNSWAQISAGSISLWFKTSSSATMSLLEKYGAYGLRMVSGKLEVENSGGAQTTGTYNDGAWHHALLVFNAMASGTVLYVDGAQVLTATVTVSAQTSNLTVGAYKNTTSSATGFFNGYLDEVSIHSGQLTATDASNLNGAGRGTIW